ncbi:ICE2 [Phaffia rhodozyma]|uniref:ICE2 n=1 Tax=Phaffia rhodozyma TaxID=264483 RepID=A0A0F7SWD8_PHARH|nr:ICE2 [Phaffia rhodozyma]
MAFLLRSFSRFIAFAQVVIGLPLVLDVLGLESFLLYSLMLTGYQIFYSTLTMSCKNTPLARLPPILKQLLLPLPSLFLILTFKLHLDPPSASSTLSVLLSTAPTLWSSFLRSSSPVFVLLEGLASLLVIQALGRAVKNWIDLGEREGEEVRGFGVLVGSSVAYVVAIWSLFTSFPPPPTTSPYPSFLLGIVLSTTLFLTIVGFRLRRTNVVESALVLAYVAWSVWLLEEEGGWSRPAGEDIGLGAYESGSAKERKGRGRHVTDLGELVRFSVGGVGEVVRGLLDTLPLPLLIALIYRLTVLHVASRIILFIRRQIGSYSPSPRTASIGSLTPSEDEDESSSAPGPSPAEGAVDDEAERREKRENKISIGQEASRRRRRERKENDEAPSAKITSVLLSYRRGIMIAVYTHLLLLDHSQAQWRWASITLFLSIWAAELLLPGEEDNTTGSLAGLGSTDGLGLGIPKEWKVE